MQIETKAQTTDCAAILMMLAYVEAECRRLGAEGAAQHAAMAAALVTRPGLVADLPASRRAMH
jgi:hypothetical protein